jgi:DNA-binding beta-propeller fold protein YncE
MLSMNRFGSLILLACTGLSSGGAPAAEPVPAAPASCEPNGDMHYLCGLEAVEDLVRIEGTRWLLGSGLGGPNRPGTLVLIDTRAKQAEVLFPASGAKFAPDAKRFPDCTTPPDPAKFNAHGITIRPAGGGDKEFLVVNHGGREAIEFFHVGMGGSKPALTWLGCVHMPPDTSINSLDSLPDGGFVATQFYVPSKGGIGAVFAREITGGLLEWHPGGAVKMIPGTELSGANGILLADGGRVMYVAAWGTRELVRFERKGDTVTRRVVPVDFAPDNLRWNRDGKLLVAGQKFVARREGPAGLDGWTVAVADPDTLKVTKLREVDGTAPFQGVSSALEVGDEIWVGPFRGDRIAWFPRPH